MNKTLEEVKKEIILTDEELENLINKKTERLSGEYGDKFTLNVINEAKKAGAKSGKELTLGEKIILMSYTAFQMGYGVGIGEYRQYITEVFTEEKERN